MSDVCAIAVGAVSALGIGRDAYAVSRAGEPAPVAIRRDPGLASAGLLRPFAARAPETLPPAGTLPGGADRATALLALALAQAAADLDRVRPGWRDLALGVAVGTSSGGMLTAERFFAARAAGEGDLGALARSATYFAPLDDALAAVGLAGARVVKRTQVLAACSASTIAIGLAKRWLERGACDLVLAGGYDALSVFVAAGFEALRATTASVPRPFAVGRDGMSLGEGAGVLALVRDRDLAGARPLVRVTGFGASTDAVHITAPDRTGGGLARAGAAALADAGIPAARVGLVSAHATSTPFNDAMESKAIAALFAGGEAPVVHPFKAQIGHTLGAAGVLETLAAADALEAGVAPAAAISGDPDPDAPARLLSTAERRDLGAALKLSAAFGGANAALVIERADRPSGARPARQDRRVVVRAHAHVDAADLVALSAATGVARDRLARLDALCRLGLAAVAALAAEVGREALRGAGLVAGHALATLDTNDHFDEKKRSRGPTGVEPRLFPATSPNAIAGECAIVYGLTGPGFAVGAGLDGGMEALSIGAEVVAAGDCDRMVVLAADDAGPVAHDLLRHAGWAERELRAGAVALLLEPMRDPPARSLEPEGTGDGRRVDADVAVDHAGAPIGHLSVLRWLRR